MKHNRFTTEEIRDFCLSLEHLLRAGIRAGDGFALMTEDEDQAARKAVLTELAAQADRGRTMAEIIRSSGCFPAYVGELIAVGERTGRLEEAVGALAAFYDQRLRLERQIRTSLAYPAVLLVIMLAVITVLLVRVLPVFDQVYAQLGSHLTGIAGGLLAFGQVLGRWMPLLLGLLAICVAAGGLFAVSASFRETLGGWWNRRFGLRGVSGQLHRAKIARVMAMGMQSGLAMEEVLLLASKMAADVPALSAACEACGQQLAAGAPLVQTLKRYEILPAAECRLLEVAVRSGSGDEAMAGIALRLQEESEAALETAVGRVEPAIVVVTSLLIGLILLSVMLPLVHIMTAIG